MLCPPLWPAPCQLLPLPFPRPLRAPPTAPPPPPCSTLVVTEECLLHPSRNPHYGKAGIEAVLKEYLGLEKIIWLWKGVAGDDSVVNGALAAGGWQLQVCLRRAHACFVGAVGCTRRGCAGQAGTCHSTHSPTHPPPQLAPIYDPCHLSRCRRPRGQLLLLHLPRRGGPGLAQR